MHVIQPLDQARKKRVKHLLKWGLCLVLLCLGCYAQTTQGPVTQDELQYLRFMLVNLASLDHSPVATNSFEASLVPAFGLNSQETVVIRAAAQSLKPLLTQIRQSARALVAGKSALTAADLNSLSDLAAQREAQILTLANHILNSVRPETAARLRMAGTIAVTGVRTARGGK
jgi:hypothetical protein